MYNTHLHSEIPVLLLISAGLCLAQSPAQPPAAPAPPSPPTQTVVVTGTFQPVALDEIDRSVFVLPVRESGLLLNSLADALRLDPSLDLQARAPDGVQTDLSIRGSTFGQTLVLLDGQRLNDVQSGHHDMDIPVPLDSVGRVEVMLGSGSALYGSDASGGVINIITAPPEGWEIRLRTAFGNDGTNQQRLSLADTFGALSEQLSFARDFSDGFRPDRDYRNLQLASTTRLQTALGWTALTFAYMDHPFGADQFYGPYPSWEDTKTWWFSFRQALGKRTSFDFAYRRHSDLFVLFRDDPAIYTNHHHDQDFQTSLRRSDPLAANTTFSYGLEAIHESIVSNNLGIHARSRAAAYAALDFRALKRFSLSVAAREEIYRDFSAEFSPSISGGAWLTPHLKLRASASRAFRVPTYTDLYYSDPANQGNPHLLPEHSWTYETGLDWNPAPRVRAGVTVFERRERDGIDYYLAPGSSVYQALNIDSLNFTGVESSLHLALSPTQTLDFRYTWLLGVQDTVPIGQTKYTFGYPRDSGVVAWQGSLPGGIVARTRFGVLNRLTEDPYVLWDFYAAWSRGKVHPFLQLANITNTSYQEIQGVVMPGRTILGGVEILVNRH
jgi:iron complex outermembrane receptor protein